MPSFTSRQYAPGRFRSMSVSKADLDRDDMMEDITPTTARPKDTTTSQLSSSLTLVPSDGSLLDYFDLPSPPSTPQRPAHNLSFSSLNSFPSPTTNPDLFAPSPRLSISSASPPSFSSSTTATPTTIPHWPTAAHRIHHRLPTRTRPGRSRSLSSLSPSSSSSSSSSSPTPPDAADVDMMDGGGTELAPVVAAVRTPARPRRRTPYYPPNASRNVDRARVYMNRGPHYVPNWTPLASLPRHVQLRIEERLVRFTAI